MIESNPNNPTPPEIESQIIAIHVDYIDFNGEDHTGIIEANQIVAKDIKDFFAKAREIEFPIEKVAKSSDAPYEWDDDRLNSTNTSSGFNYRVIKRTGQPSLHGYGLAIDINPRLNPYIGYNGDVVEVVVPAGATYDPTQPGVFTPDHELVEFMKDRGWEWGGEWTKESGRIDYQHFEKRLSDE